MATISLRTTTPPSQRQPLNSAPSPTFARNGSPAPLRNASPVPLSNDSLNATPTASPDAVQTITTRRSLTNQDQQSIDEIVCMLRRLQSRTGMRNRFHLFMESEVACIPQMTSNPARVNRRTYNVDLDTNILFSPTISFPIKSDKHRKLMHNLICTVNELSILSIKTPMQQNETRILPTQTLTLPVRRPIRRLFTSDDEESDSIDDDLLSIEPFTVPHWFPFQLPEYSSGLQTSSSDPLAISENIARKFDSLPNEDIPNLYRTFFEMMHSCAKRKKRDYKQGKLKYSMFTPPWIRGKLMVSGLVCEMPKLSIQDQREQRNKQGFRRMAWILGAFYERESCFGRYILDYLLQKLPLLRKEWSERNEARKQHATPVQRVLANKRKKRKPTLRNRRTKRKIDLSQDQDRSDAIETSPNSRAHDAIVQEAPFPQHDLDNGGIDAQGMMSNPMAPTHRESLESTNKRLPLHSTSLDPTVISASGNQDDGDKRNISSVFDGLIPTPQIRTNGSTNAILPPNNISISQRTNGGPPLISISSGSSGNKPPTGRKPRNRALPNDPIILEASEDDRQTTANDNPKRIEGRNKIRQHSIPTKNTASAPASSDGLFNSNQVFMSMHGVRFNLDVTDKTLQNPEMMDGISRNNESNDNNQNVRAASNKNSDPQGIVAIVCAAGTKCYFRNSAEAQQPDGITGRCRRCSKHLHDLCGGGEMGNMMCANCQ